MFLVCTKRQLQEKRKKKDVAVIMNYTLRTL